LDTFAPTRPGGLGAAPSAWQLARDAAAQTAVQAAFAVTVPPPVPPGTFYTRAAMPARFLVERRHRQGRRREHANPWGSLPSYCGCPFVIDGAEAVITCGRRPRACRPARRCARRERAAGGLQRVFGMHREMPPVQHHRGLGQHRALQPSQSGIAVAQHRRRRVRSHSRRSEHLLERLGCSHWTSADKGQAMLDTPRIDDLARDHLEVAPLPLCRLRT
jgi:hypothetical protein